MTFFTVSDDSEGARLDRFLVAVLPERSRSQIQRLIKDGHVRVSGREAKPNQPVKTGQQIAIDIPEPIGRDPSNRKKMSARARRSREAVTRIVRAEHLKALTLAQVAIHTGRTHQIRVHLSAIGHPIVGDPLYGGLHRRVPGDLRAVTHLDRPFLHAARLAFKHPADGRRMEFTSALPHDLQRVLDELRAKHEIAD